MVADTKALQSLHLVLSRPLGPLGPGALCMCIKGSTCCCCRPACRSEKVLQLLERHIQAITSRVNTITGVAYKDDPTIIGYNLFNEPRYVQRRTGLPKCPTQGFCLTVM
jgi:hypothetical protein